MHTRDDTRIARALGRDERVGISWSHMRRILEQEWICDSLRGRIQYFATRYRKSHDQEGRIAIRLDGTEIFRSNFFDWATKRNRAWNDMKSNADRSIYYAQCGDAAELTALNEGGFDQFAFNEAFYAYQNSSIDDSLASPDPVVRMLAIVDRRVGKRRLQGIASDVEGQPEWLRAFYRLRLQVEGIVDDEDGKDGGVDRTQNV